MLKFASRLFIVSSLLLLNGCGDKGTVGFVGTPVEITIDLMTEDGQFDFQWTILRQPDASLLTTKDITQTESPAVFSFIPDAKGIYTIEVNVSQYGDELFTEIHSFDIQKAQDQEVMEEPLPISTPIEPEPIIEPESEPSKPVKSWLDEEFPEDTLKTEITADESSEVKEISKPKPETQSAPKPGSSIPYLEDRYTIQIASSKSLEEAEKVALKLIDDGYDAYIQKAYFKETDEIWFRVRVGSYENRKEAVNVSNLISSKFGYTIWIDFVRKEN